MASGVAALGSPLWSRKGTHLEHTSNRTADVVVVRALRGLGDILCAVPSLRLIRSSLPDARVRFIGVGEVEGLVGRFGDYVDEFVRFPGYPGIPEGGGAIGEGLATDTIAPDLVLQIHGDGSVSNGFAASLRPRALAAHGTVVADHGCAVATRPYDRTRHEVERCLRVTDDGLRLIGAQPAQPTSELEFRLYESERAEAEALLTERGLAGKRFVAVHPGSHLPDRRWPADRFAALAARLAEAGLNVVVTGTADEAELAARVAAGNGVSIAGKLSLGGLGALLERSAGIVTNDTGVSHLAAAVKAPSVVVFMASDPHRWAPLDATRHRAVVHPSRPGSKPNAVSPEGLALSIPAVAETFSAARAVGIV